MRVLAYNIHHGRGADGEINLERIADVISRAKPDLVALQEVDVKAKRTGGVDQAARLAELTGMHHTFAEAMPFQGGSYGEAILTSNNLLPEVVPQRTGLSLFAPPGHEPRAVALGGIYPSDEMTKVATFAGTHLCHQSKQVRLTQVQQIDTSLHDGSIVLAGDFNFTPDSDEYRYMIANGWVDAAAAFGDPKPTVPADKPTKRIDYVFVRPAERWRVIDVQVLDEPIASDHAPLLVELEYVPPAP